MIASCPAADSIGFFPFSFSSIAKGFNAIRKRLGAMSTSTRELHQQREDRQLQRLVFSPIRKIIWVLQKAFAHPISLHYWTRCQRRQMLEVIQYHPDCEEKTAAVAVLSLPTATMINVSSRKKIRDLVNAVWYVEVKSDDSVEEEHIKRPEQNSALEVSSPWPELPSVADLVMDSMLGPSLDPDVTRALMSIIGDLPFNSISFKGIDAEKPIIIEVESQDVAQLLVSRLHVVSSASGDLAPDDVVGVKVGSSNLSLRDDRCPT